MNNSGAYSLAEADLQRAESLQLEAAPSGACGVTSRSPQSTSVLIGCGTSRGDEPSNIYKPFGDDGKLTALEARLSRVLQEPDLAVLRTEDISRFCWHVNQMLQVDSWWSQKLASPEKLPPMDILRLIIQSKNVGDLDEAFWRGFLAAHFGRGSADPRNPLQVESAGRFLFGFSDNPIWTWDVVSSELAVFQDWLNDHADHLWNDLAFGNHRKRRSKQPSDLFMVVESFVRFVDQYGGTPQLAFTPRKAQTPEDAFDELFYRVMELHDFGRTAALDTLILFGELRLLDVQPGSVYLQGATGPLEGARKLWGRLPVKELERRADALARRTQVPFDIVEDALCMWQK